MKNRWINALVKTLVTIVVIHAIMLVLGVVFGTQIGWFNIPMIWAHWHTNGNITTGIVGLIILYFGIYFFGTRGCDCIESHH